LTSGYQFEHYQNHFNKAYSHPLEAAQRKIIFEERLKMILEHNENEGSTWRLGVNQFTDRTEQELKAWTGLNKGLVHERRSGLSFESSNIDVSELPSEVDWRRKGAVTPVKDQGRCGSCWAFAASETVESMWQIATGNLVELSEQHILDCTPNPNHCGGTGGCQGATVELAYDMVKLNGLASEWTYPYNSYNGDNFNCSDKIVPVAKLSSYVVLPTNELDPVLKAVAEEGPLAVSVDASQWFLYESGVFDGCNQVNPDIDHAVQLVGYGSDAKMGDYWLVRNSWSPFWGENGYIRLKRTSDVRCGIDITPEHGDGCDNGPPQVKVCGTCGILYDNVYPKH